MKVAVIFAFALATTGCAFHRTPFEAYDKSIPLKDTSVFSAVANDPINSGAFEILQIDGKNTDCFEVGCPVWARVSPGKHKFLLRFKSDFKLEAMFITWKTAILQVEVPSMQSRHVYVVSPNISNNQVSTTVEDLGENPPHGIWLGLEGANRKFYPVQF